MSIVVKETELEIAIKIDIETWIEMDYYLNIPNKVDTILRLLRANGHKAYIVGGCVRDILMGRKPADWDITTSATPDEVESIFGKPGAAATASDMPQSGATVEPQAGATVKPQAGATVKPQAGARVPAGTKIIETGLKHGTVTVVMGRDTYEITTFRSDGTYSDGRHPDSVTFSRDVKEDLARRDFTMNALAYSPNEGIVDEFGGIKDIEAHVIRAVGDPRARFSEDYLRVMRAIRFCGTLGFLMEQGTEAAVRELAPHLGEIVHGAGVSVERINIEFTKLLMGAYSAFAMKRYRQELDSVLAPVGLKLADRKSIKSLEHAPASLPLRLALTLSAVQYANAGKPVDAASGDAGQTADAKSENALAERLRAFKYDNRTIRLAAAIYNISRHKVHPEKPVVKLEMRRLADDFDDGDVPDILMDGISVRSLKSILPDWTTEKTFGIIAGIVDGGECYSRSGLAVSGEDIIGLGVEPGERVGRILGALLDEVIAEELTNDRDALLGRAKSLAELL